MTALRTRFQSLGSDDLFAHLELVRGTLNDYQSLAEHHYRDRRPATFMRVLAIRHHFTLDSPMFPSRMSKPRTIAVLVESMPPLNCRMRDVALTDRYRRVKNGRTRAAMINRELRTISRVIIHPQWRGLGLAEQMVRAARMTATTVFTESIAAMGRVHPFFSRAGMTAFPRPAHEHDARLRTVLRSLGLSDELLATPSVIIQQMSQLPDQKTTWLKRELQRWYRTTRRTTSLPSLGEILRHVQRSLLCEPVYFLRDNRQSETTFNRETPNVHANPFPFTIASPSKEQQRHASAVIEQTETPPSPHG